MLVGCRSTCKDKFSLSLTGSLYVTVTGNYLDKINLRSLRWRINVPKFLTSSLGKVRHNLIAFGFTLHKDILQQHWTPLFSFWHMQYQNFLIFSQHHNPKLHFQMPPRIVWLVVFITFLWHTKTDFSRHFEKKTLNGWWKIHQSIELYWLKHIHKDTCAINSYVWISAK